MQNILWKHREEGKGGKDTICLGFVALDAGPEKKIGVCEVYLGGDPRKYGRRVGK